MSAAALRSEVETPFVTSETAGGIARLTLARPQRRNALSEGMMEALGQTLDRAAGDEAVRVVVIAAEGPAFCAGHDLKELGDRRGDPDRGRAYYQAVMARCAELMTAIVRHPRPVIAEVQGLATAAGCQLVASCDLALASESAGFCTPGVDIGLFCSTPMVALSRNLGRKHAMEMLLTGDTVSAEEACAMGLVNRVVPPGRLRAETDALARRIAAKPPATVRTGKEAFYAQAEMTLADAYAYAAGVMVENMLHRDAEEGIGAFLEKRPPRWTA